MRLAIDAMGGDHAPRELVAGAVEAARQDENLEVQLVGPEEVVQAELSQLDDVPSGIRVVHAGGVISMDDKPVEALKRCPDASILKAMQLVGTREADAVIGAGSTGAVVAAATMALKRLPGVRRPGIAVPLPALNEKGVALLLDAGANPACRPHHLAQYAVMGANYYKSAWGTDNPRVGLVSIGEEEAKGNDFTRESATAIRTTDVNFMGNVESRGLFGGDCEVAVADGFVGNIILKTGEGVAELLLGRVKSVIGSSDPKSFLNIAKSFDYASFGGAPLLGVDGTVIVCHGRSDRRAISNAILVAARAVAGHVNDNIVAGLARQREA
ncbi:MAG: phosphate acyltransferase PlsX [Planctomycetota bacterium]